MGLFGGRARREKEQLQRSWHGRLSAKLWNADEEHESYFNTARQTEVEFAETALRRRLGEPLPRDVAATATRLMPITGAEGSPPLQDGVRSAYLLSWAETWDDLDSKRIRVIARECCAAAARNGHPEVDSPRMRAGAALAGLVGNHPEHPSPLRAFAPLYDHIASQPSHKRLTATGARFAEMTLAAFGMAGSPGETPADLPYRLAWHLGLSLWIWERCEFLKDPTLERTR